MSMDHLFALTRQNHVDNNVKYVEKLCSVNVITVC